MLGNSEDAKDAVQELFVKLCSKSNQIEDMENPKGYGVKILQNICIDTIRKRKIEYNIYQTEEKESSLKNIQASKTSNTDNVVEMDETMSILKRCIDKLPINQRQIIIMRDIEQMDMKDIEKTIGLSQGNIRVLLSRGRNTIKEYFKNYYHK